jgi:hypothetical protein
LPSRVVGVFGIPTSEVMFGGVVGRTLPDARVCSASSIGTGPEAVGTSWVVGSCGLGIPLSGVVGRIGVVGQAPLPEAWVCLARSSSTGVVRMAPALSRGVGLDGLAIPDSTVSLGGIIGWILLSA